MLQRTSHIKGGEYVIEFIFLYNISIFLILVYFLVVFYQKRLYVLLVIINYIGNNIRVTFGADLLKSLLGNS